MTRVVLGMRVSIQLIGGSVFVRSSSPPPPPPKGTNNQKKG